MVLEVVGALAFIVSAIAIAPQARRVVRTGETEGVSADWALLGAISTAVWTVYTAFSGPWWATVADALASASYTVTVVVLVRRGISPRWIVDPYGPAFGMIALVAGITILLRVVVHGRRQSEPRSTTAESSAEH